MLGQGKLTNLRVTDQGLVAEVLVDTMTPEMVEATLGHVRVDLTIADAQRARLRDPIAAVQAATVTDDIASRC